MSKKVVIFATHPIQYHAPWFRALSAQPDLDVTVHFGCLPDAEAQGAGFGRAFEWDVPLLNGYRWGVLDNWRGRPGIAGFSDSIARGVTETLLKAQPDVVVVTGWQQAPLLQAAWSARRLGIPCIVRGESNGLKPRSRRVRYVHRKLLELYDAFLVIGESNERFYEGNGISNERLFRCPYFIDNDYFSVRAERLRVEHAGLRKNWNIPKDSICFLFVGKLIQKKRIMDFLRALEAVAKRDDSIFGLVVGTGELEAEARAFVELKQLPVTFAGFLNQSEIAAAYMAADCLVLPSDYGETWGLVVNEAMACGIPAIVSDQVGCGPDLVTEGETGARFQMGDVGRLAEVMVRQARDPEMLKVMGDAARRRVVKQYPVERTVKGTMDAIEWVLKRRGSTCGGNARDHVAEE